MEALVRPTGPSPGVKNQISPTGFEEIRLCFLRFAFRQDHNFTKHVIPNPASVLGIASHKLYQELWSGSLLGIDNPRARLESMWEEEVSTGFAKMKEAAFGAVPEPKTWPFYQMKRISTILDIVSIASGHKQSRGTTSASTKAEVWLKGHGGLMVGQADVIHTTDAGTEIVDYKTGRIFESEESSNGGSTLKPAYERQLLIYSDLYHEMNGEWPILATVSSLNDGSYSIVPDPVEAGRISSEAMDFLERFNEQAATAAFDASPSEEACLYCQFKAVCTAYLDRSEIGWESTGTTIRGTVIGIDTDGRWIRLTNISGNTNRTEVIVIQVPSVLIGSAVVGEILSFSSLTGREEKETLDFRWWSQMWKWTGHESC